LTRDGREKMRAISRAMKKMDLGLDLILSSPYLRAAQTAAIAATILRAEKLLKYSEHLGSSGDARALIKELAGLPASQKRVVLVGHEPYLSRLISLLLTGSATGLEVTLKKGGLCKMSVSRLKYGRCATLEWLLTAKQLIVMG
jgi:phosphohistidine phosphatase